MSFNLPDQEGSGKSYASSRGFWSPLRILGVVAGVALMIVGAYLTWFANLDPNSWTYHIRIITFVLGIFVLSVASGKVKTKDK